MATWGPAVRPKQADSALAINRYKLTSSMDYFQNWLAPSHARK